MVLDGLKFWKRGEAGPSAQGFGQGPDLGGGLDDDPMQRTPDPLSQYGGDDPLQQPDPMAMQQGHPYGNLGMPMRSPERYPEGGTMSHLTTRNPMQHSPMAPDPDPGGQAYGGGYEAAPPQQSRDRDMELVLAKLDAIRHALERLEGMDERLKGLERRMDAQQQQRRTW